GTGLTPPTAPTLPAGAADGAAAGCGTGAAAWPEAAAGVHVAFAPVWALSNASVQVTLGSATGTMAAPVLPAWAQNDTRCPRSNDQVPSGAALPTAEPFEQS